MVFLDVLDYHAIELEVGQPCKSTCFIADLEKFQICTQFKIPCYILLIPKVILTRVPSSISNGCREQRETVRVPVQQATLLVNTETWLFACIQWCLFVCLLVFHFVCKTVYTCAKASSAMRKPHHRHIIIFRSIHSSFTVYFLQFLEPRYTALWEKLSFSFPFALHKLSSFIFTWLV